MPNIDQLTLEINTEAGKAADKLGDLISKLEKLSGITGSVGTNLQTISKGINSVNNSFKKLNQLDFDKTNKSIQNLNNALSSMKVSVKSFADTSSQIKTISSAINSLNRAITKISQNQGTSKFNLNGMTFNVNQYQKANNALSKNNSLTGSNIVNLLAQSVVLHKVAEGFGYVVSKANDYIETLNLFNVVMGESTQKASEFVDSLEVIGVDMEQAMRYQASFYDIGKSLGVSTKNAYTLSEQLTKLSYDYASLYNLPVEESFQKLQAAIVGTTEPIRRLGKDISVAKLEETALNLGITESVRNMTQAEKAQLRFITIMEQSSAAMNDMERTINSPANALRVLQAQFTSFTRELGGLFIPIITEILPYLIAFTKLLRQIVADIAAFFGIDLLAFDFNAINSSLGIADQYSGDLSDNLDDSASSAKKLKDLMLGIDELNVLNADTGTAGINTGAAGVGSGFDLDLEDFGYDQILTEVQSKADEIYQSLLKWKEPLMIVAGILGGLFVVKKFVELAKVISGIWGAIKGFTAVSGVIASAVSWLEALGMTLAGGSSALTAIGGASGVAAGGLGAVAVGAAAVVAAIAAVGVVIWGVVEALSPAVEKMDVFADVSEETKNKLEPVISTWEELDKTVRQYNWTNHVITDEDAESVVNKVSDMVDRVLAEVDSDKNQALKDVELLRDAEGISQETYRSMLNDVTSYYDDLESETKDAQDRINEIYRTASEEKRSLTDEEATELETLQNQIRDNAIETMSESATEQLAIMRKLKYNQTAITVEAGSELLQQAVANKEALLQEADDWRVRMLSNLDNRFSSEEAKNSEEYKKQQEAIEEHYAQMVADAEQGYDDIYQQVVEGMGEQAKYIDEETGNIKSNWDVWLYDLGTSWNNFWGGLQTWWNEIITGLSEWWGGITKKFDEWKKEAGKLWNNFWGGLETWYQEVIDDFGDWMKGIWKEITGWFTSIADGWNNFWGGLGTWWDETFGGKGKAGSASVDVGVRYRTTSMPTPNVQAFAGGGFVPTRANFISPDMWTAGEAGRELIGSYQGRTTVMPLENTSFVSTMYEAVYSATRAALESQDDSPLVVNVTAKLDSKDVYNSMQDYEYSSGKSLVKKIKR